MTLERIYEDYTPASQGFVAAVQTYCGFCITDSEISRLAEKARSASQFQAIWENETFWLDANNK